MNTNKLSLILGLIAGSLMFISCQKEDERTEADELAELEEYLVANNITQDPTWTGLYYLEDSAGTGPNIQFGDTVVIEYTESLLSGVYIESSDDFSEDIEIPFFNNIMPSGLNEAFTYMKEGTVAKVIVPSSLAYKGYSFDMIHSYATLVFDMEIVEIRPGTVVEPYDVSGLTLNTTSSGLQYYEVESNDSTAVLYAEQAVVRYTAYFVNGRVFDSTVKLGSDATLIISELIPGFVEGLKLMNVGEKYRLIIPYDLAYGETGRVPIIPPYTDLIFDVEIIDII